MGKRIIVSASSDIGFELGASWVRAGHDVLGTFRDGSAESKVTRAGMSAVHLDLSKSESISAAKSELSKWLKGQKWEALVLAAGSMMPIGKFRDANFEKWAEAFEINFLAQASILQSLLDEAEHMAQVIFFAGAGTNSAAENFSSYSVSKIAGIKLFEVLAAEEPRIKFTSLGPGWVKSKIHNETLLAGRNAGNALLATEQRLRDQDFFPIEKVIEALDWIVQEKPDLVSGRNFSAVNDPLKSSELASLLTNSPDMFKLRRSGNHMLSSD